MRVDEFDNTLVSEEEDISMFFNSFKDLREVPFYIESEILNIVLNSLGISNYNKYSVEEKLMKLPKSFIEYIINLLGSKFSKNESVDYSNFYIPYLMYYLPCNIYKIWKPLMDLHIKSLLKPSINVLDIGTGPGSIPVGIIEFYKEIAIKYKDMDFFLSFTLIEKEKEFINIATNIVNSIKKHLPSNLIVELSRTYNDVVTEIYNNDKLGKYDIISMSNVLSINELDNNVKGTGIVKNMKNHLKYDGSIIIIEPGNKTNCQSLKTIRNNLVNEDIYNLFSPCNRIWEEDNNYSCKCFNMTRCYWKVPKIFNYLKVNGLNDKTLRSGVPFNYIVLRMDGIKKYDIIKNQQYYTKLVDLIDKVGQTVNIIAMIRAVVDNYNQKTIALCDGSNSFGASYFDYCLVVGKDEVNKYFGNIPIIASERISLKRVRVIYKGENIRLQLTEQSKVKIEY